LRPIVQSMRKRLLTLSFLQSDDTLIQALDRELKGKSRRCYLWAYWTRAGEVVYHFTKTRSHKEPLEFLEGFSGHLQTDGFPGYNALYRTGRVEHIACLAHIRRKLFEAKSAAPDRIKEILNLIKKPYAIEEEARERGIRGQDLTSLREEKIRPLLEKIEEKIKELAPLTTPKSKLGRAVAYAQGQWPALLRYIKVPEAQLDNNWCENALRPVVLGRKNFMFLGSPAGGGERAEVFFSLVQSCRRLGVDPFRYLSDVIERISTHPAARTWELTPRGWKEVRERAEKETVRTAR